MFVYRPFVPIRIDIYSFLSVKGHRLEMDLYDFSIENKHEKLFSLKSVSILSTLPYVKREIFSYSLG